MNVKIRNESPYPLRYATEGASGLDLCANIGCERTVDPGRRWKFDTGISLAIPEGYEGQVRGRSGLRLHHGIVVPMGTIDSDYRSSIAVILFNLGEAPFVVRPGDRIGQLIIAPVARITPVLVASVDDLGETARGAKGFGSTGTR